MTQTVTRQNTAAETLMSFFLFPVLTFIFGLWEMKWQLNQLPLWFYGYCLLAGLIGMVGLRLMQADRPTRPRWQRVALLGFGWGLPVMAALFGSDLLNGDAQDPRLVLLFLTIWSVGSVVYGMFAANSKTKDWI